MAQDLRVKKFVPEERNVFAERLKKAFVESQDKRGWNQQQVEKLAGLGAGTLTRLMNGDRPNPRPLTVNRLAHVLEVDPSWLTGATDDAGTPMTPIGITPQLSDLPGYHDAEIGAVREDPTITDEVLHLVREVRMPRHAPISAKLILGLARLLQGEGTDDETEELGRKIGSKRSRKAR